MELECLTDEEQFLIHLMIELANTIEGKPNLPSPVAQRLDFAVHHKNALIRSTEIKNVNVDLVKLTRFVMAKIVLAQIMGEKK